MDQAKRSHAAAAFRNPLVELEARPQPLGIGWKTKESALPESRRLSARGATKPRQTASLPIYGPVLYELNRVLKCSLPVLMLHQNILESGRSALVIIDMQDAFRMKIADFTEVAARIAVMVQA